jgi:hypothetical protein
MFDQLWGKKKFIKSSSLPIFVASVVISRYSFSSKYWMAKGNKTPSQTN